MKRGRLVRFCSVFPNPPDSFALLLYDIPADGTGVPMETPVQKRLSPAQITSVHQAEPILQTPRRKPVQAHLAAFLLLLCAYCAWVFSLPMFPTQDGPVHLYYVDVLRHLLSHAPSAYSQFYTVRSPLPPYTIQYVLLMLLTSFLTPVLAEKCMVCLILASTAFGFRYLASAVGRNGKVLSLWIFPIALSWPLLMGFHNFCLSMSFVLWSLGLWFRAVKTERAAYRVLFLLSVAIVAMTHPVPLLFLLGITGADAVARLAQKRFVFACSWLDSLRANRWKLAAVSLASCSLGYIALFLNKHNAHEPVRPPSPWSDYMLDLIHLQRMCIASGGSFTKFYRAGLYLILVLALTAAIRYLLTGRGPKAWYRKTLTGQPALLFSAFALLLAMPFIPSRMNGLDYFAERLPFIIWLLALAAASASQLSPRVARAASYSAIVFGLFTLAIADHYVRPVAAEISSATETHLAHHKAGLIFDAPITLQDSHLSANPFFRWNGVRLFQQSGTLLLNDPWAGAPNILPIDRKLNPILAPFSQFELQHPDNFYYHLLASPADRRAILSNVDLIVFIGRTDTEAVDPLLATDTTHRWTCDQRSWFIACEASPADSSRAVAQPSVQLHRENENYDQFSRKIFFLRELASKSSKLWKAGFPYRFIPLN